MEQLGGGAKPPADRVATAFPTVDAISYRAIVLSTLGGRREVAGT